jgi:hypothetical protein
MLKFGFTECFSVPFNLRILSITIRYILFCNNTIFWGNFLPQFINGNLDDVDVEVGLRVELGLALAAAVVAALGGNVGLVVPLVDLELLALQVEFAAAVDLGTML